LNVVTIAAAARILFFTTLISSMQPNLAKPSLWNCPYTLWVLHNSHNSCHLVSTYRKFKILNSILVLLRYGNTLWIILISCGDLQSSIFVFVFGIFEWPITKKKKKKKKKKKQKYKIKLWIVPK
jgi:hypothetical protein